MLSTTSLESTETALYAQIALSYLRTLTRSFNGICRDRIYVNGVRAMTLVGSTDKDLPQKELETQYRRQNFQ